MKSLKVLMIGSLALAFSNTALVAEGLNTEATEHQKTVEEQTALKITNCNSSDPFDSRCK